MRCKNCDYEIPNENSTNYPIFCPSCGKIRGIFIMLLIVGLLFLFAGKDVYSKTIFATIIGITLLLQGIKYKRKMLTIFPGIALAVWYIALLGALNDFPYFIRQIKGVDFVGWWLGLFAIVLLVSLVAECILCKILMKKTFHEGQEKIYSDSDLMIFRGLDRYQKIGYYIFKAKVHGMIKYEDTETGGFISINTDVSEDERREYCSANPQVEKILYYIAKKSVADELAKEYSKLSKALEKNPNRHSEIIEEYRKLKEEYAKKAKKRMYTAKDLEAVRVLDIVKAVDTNPEIQSEGGIFAKQIVKKEAKTIALSVFWSFLIFGYYFAFTKLLMGIYNDKAVGDLTIAMFVAGSLISGVCYYLNYKIHDKFIYNIFIKELIDYKAKDFRDIEMLFQNFDFDSTLTAEDEKRILRAYVLYDFNSLTYKNIENPSFSCEVFNMLVSVRPIVAFETAQAIAAYKANRTSSNSGSSCSSCTSCGSSCSSCTSCGSSCSSCGGGCSSCSSCGGCGN